VSTKLRRLYIDLSAAVGAASVCPDKRTAHLRGGDRRTLQLQPLRVVVVRNGRVDVLECGHELANPWRNPNKQRHCPECPPLAEPLSEVARLREALEQIAVVAYAAKGDLILADEAITAIAHTCDRLLAKQGDPETRQKQGPEERALFSPRGRRAGDEG